MKRRGHALGECVINLRNFLAERGNCGNIARAFGETFASTGDVPFPGNCSWRHSKGRALWAQRGQLPASRWRHGDPARAHRSRCPVSTLARCSPPAVFPPSALARLLCPSFLLFTHESPESGRTRPLGKAQRALSGSLMLQRGDTLANQFTLTAAVFLQMSERCFCSLAAFLETTLEPGGRGWVRLGLPGISLVAATRPSLCLVSKSSCVF